MKRLIARFLMTFIVAISLSSLAHAATPTFYTDRGAFQAGLGSFLTDDYSPASGYPSEFNIYDNAVMSAFFGQTDYFTTGFLNWNIISSEIYCAGCNGSFRLIFTSTSFTQGGVGIFGAGVDIVSNDSSLPYHAFITYGDATTESRALPAGSSFFGVTAPELIESIHFGLSDGSPTTSGSFAIDNLTIGNQGGSADLSITKSGDPDPVTAGQMLTYTIIISNAGPSDATNVMATDILPPGVTFVSTSGCAEDPNGMPNCGLGTISTGGSKQYDITVTVDPGTTGTLTNNVSVLSDLNDPDTSNNSSSEDTIVNASADLSVSKSGDPDPVTAGQMLTYTIIVSNAGPSDAANVVATDTLPPGVTFVSTSGCAEDPNGMPNCGLGTITTGGSKQYDITVTVDPGTTGTLTNSVSVSSDALDPDTLNSSTSTNTLVREIVPIPTMTEWGVIIFMALASIVAIYNLKKRSNALK